MSSSNPSTFFNFLSLPPEIRHLIYHQIFFSSTEPVRSSISATENEKGLITLSTNTPTSSSSSLNLRRTCRTILNETHEYFTSTYTGYEQIVFSTSRTSQGVEADGLLPGLGQHLSSSIPVTQCKGIKRIVVGITDLWRILNSLHDLEESLPAFDRIQAVAVKRMPYGYWKEKFPTVVSFLRSTSTQHTSIIPEQENCWSSILETHHRHHDEGEVISDSELSRFRVHVRSHPTINEDERYIEDDEDDWGYTDDRGEEFFRRDAFDSVFATLTGIELVICSRWILVDRNWDRDVVLVAETTFELRTGRILALRSVPAADGVELYQNTCLRSREALADLERRTVRNLHLKPSW